MVNLFSILIIITIKDKNSNLNLFSIFIIITIKDQNSNLKLYFDKKNYWYEIGMHT
jgi:hypothetical protein